MNSFTHQRSPRFWCASVLFLCVSMLLAACQAVPQKKQTLGDRQITALKQVGFVRTEEGWEFSASDKVLFATNESTLTPEAQKIVEHIGQVLISIQVERIRIDGHTDSEGAVAYNEQLSLRRATAVANTLTGVGLSPQAIKVRGLGMSAPIADNRTAEGRMQNRRVAIVISVN